MCITYPLLLRKMMTRSFVFPLHSKDLKHLLQSSISAHSFMHVMPKDTEETGISSRNKAKSSYKLSLLRPRLTKFSITWHEFRHANRLIANNIKPMRVTRIIQFRIAVSHP